jgi:hypothetical protein
MANRIRITNEDDKVLKAARDAGIFYAAIVKAGNRMREVLKTARSYEDGITHKFIPNLGTWEKVGR